MRRILSLGTLLVVLAGLGLAAPGAPHVLAATTNVSVEDNFYMPASVTINVGDTVDWTWAGVNSHTVTATDSSFDSGSPQSSGTFDHTFSAVGTFTYFCQVHGQAMSGTVVVQEAPAAATATTQPAAATATSAPASTSTSTAGASPMPAAAASATPRVSASPVGPTTIAVTPTASGGAAPGTQLPRSGTGGHGGGGTTGDLLLVALAVVGVGSIGMALAVRRRT